MNWMATLSALRQWEHALGISESRVAIIFVSRTSYCRRRDVLRVLDSHRHRSAGQNTVRRERFDAAIRPQCSANDDRTAREVWAGSAPQSSQTYSASSDALSSSQGMHSRRGAGAQ